jgi:hypothetical protein
MDFIGYFEESLSRISSAPKFSPSIGLHGCLDPQALARERCSLRADQVNVEATAGESQSMVAKNRRWTHIELWCFGRKCSKISGYDQLVIILLSI